MTSTATERPGNEVPPWYRNVRVLGWIFQTAVAGAALLIVAWLLRNYRNNSENLGIPTGFDYLDQPANFPIAGSDFRTSESVWEATKVGIKNTLAVVLAGIFLSTLLGLLIGIARLSKNWLVNKAAAVYVETLRNVPLLVIVVFTYLALVISTFPKVEDAWEIFGIAVLSNRSAAVLWYDGSTWWLLGALVAGGAAAYGVERWRSRVADNTGTESHAVVAGIGTFLVVTLATLLIGGVGITTPTLDGRLIEGGMSMGPEYLALLIALVIYTASHIAEVVRGSIQAVPTGQQEAANALALNGSQRLAYVVLPQAMRIAIPPLGNQYLNLFKNSSLAVVISYFELTKITLTAVGNGQPAVPAYGLLMLIYLVGSLIISQFVNFANRRLALADR